MKPIVTSSRPRRSRSANSGFPRAAVIAAATIVVAVIAVYLSKGKGVDKPSASPEQPASAIPVKVDDGVQTSVATNAAMAPSASDARSAVTNAFVKRPGAMMLPSGKVLTFPPPSPGKVEKVYAEGHLYECDSEGNWKDVTKRKLFKTAFELNFLGLSIDGKPFIPTFLLGLDQNEVVEILKKDYEAIGDETEEEMAEIQAYLEMKAAALDYIEQGGKFDDFVTEIASFVQAERNIRAKSLRQVMQLYKEGRYDEARDRALELEDVLEKQGYKPMTIPPHVREKLGI